MLLNERIATSFGEIRDQLIAAGAASIAVAGAVDTSGFTASLTVLAIDAPDLSPAVAEEAFGPLVVLARYDDPEEIYAALDAVPDSLTATIHHEPGEPIDELVRELAPRAGRIVFNGYPTGVRVSWGQHHGGTWPSTNSQHTSVGVSAIRRFLRPIAFQGAPESVLPASCARRTSTASRVVWTGDRVSAEAWTRGARSPADRIASVEVELRAEGEALPVARVRAGGRAHPHGEVEALVDPAPEEPFRQVARDERITRSDRVHHRDRESIAPRRLVAAYGDGAIGTQGDHDLVRAQLCDFGGELSGAVTGSLARIEPRRPRRTPGLTLQRTPGRAARDLRQARGPTDG